MRRLRPSQCGYAQYKCVGINLLPPPKPVCCDNRAAPTSRQNDNNFYNIPRVFQGIIQQTRFINLSDEVESTSLCCNFKYDPFNENGFSDLFDTVKGRLGPDYSNSLADYGCTESSYMSDSGQKPGFLLPTAELNDFYPATLQAIPTVALASPVGTIPHVDVDLDIESACSGFKIRFWRNTVIGDNNYTLNVTGGQAIVYDSGAQIPIDMKTWNYPNPGDGREINLQIYIYVWWKFDSPNKGWNGQIIYKQESDSFGPSYPINRWTKLAQIGTVKRTIDGNILIIQQVCSPVDVRDWVSGVPLPDVQTQNVYVFTYQSGNAKTMKWMQVKDC